MAKIKVDYIDHMGNDLTVVNSARVSFGSSKTELDAKDKKLIKYLADHKHYSVFEHCSLTVKISCPLYIRSQIHRHRTFSYNEISRRYTDKNLEFYKPDVYRLQHESNKQASYGALPHEAVEDLKIQVENLHQASLKLYEDMIAMGVCKEQARGVLAQDLMTEFYMTGNLRNWAHFLNLRDKPDAQVEVQEVAKQVKSIILEKFEYSAKVLLGEQDA